MNTSTRPIQRAAIFLILAGAPLSVASAGWLCDWENDHDRPWFNPSCEPTWGYHPTTWRTYPEHLSNSGQGSYCPTGACDSGMGGPGMTGPGCGMTTGMPSGVVSPGTQGGAIAQPLVASPQAQPVVVGPPANAVPHQNLMPEVPGVPSLPAPAPMGGVQYFDAQPKMEQQLAPGTQMQQYQMMPQTQQQQPMQQMQQQPMQQQPLQQLQQQQPAQQQPMQQMQQQPMQHQPLQQLQQQQPMQQPMPEPVQQPGMNQLQPMQPMPGIDPKPAAPLQPAQPIGPAQNGFDLIPGNPGGANELPPLPQAGYYQQAPTYRNASASQRYGAALQQNPQQLQMPGVSWSQPALQPAGPAGNSGVQIQNQQQFTAPSQPQPYQPGPTAVPQGGRYQPQQYNLPRPTANSTTLPVNLPNNSIQETPIQQSLLSRLMGRGQAPTQTPADYQPQPQNGRTYPMSSQPVPVGNQSFPANGQVFPAANQGMPGTSQSFPAGTQSFPTATPNPFQQASQSSSGNKFGLLNGIFGR